MAKIKKKLKIKKFTNTFLSLNENVINVHSGKLWRKIQNR